MRCNCLLQKINMAARGLATKPQLLLNVTLWDIQGRFLHTSPALLKVKAGKVKITPNCNRPVNYEDAFSPPHIAHRKSWNSWNTSTIEGGHRPSQIATDDLFIRKFMSGTFPECQLSKIIIKRQYNVIRIAGILKYMPPPSVMCFLIGYTEELLSHWFQCIVKLELQILKDKKCMIFKYI